MFVLLGGAGLAVAADRPAAAANEQADAARAEAAAAPLIAALETASPMFVSRWPPSPARS